jgi:hypothetical protein
LTKKKRIFILKIECVRKKKISQKGYGLNNYTKQKRIFIPKGMCQNNNIPKRILVKQLYQKRNFYPKKECVKNIKISRKGYGKGIFTASCATVRLMMISSEMKLKKPAKWKICHHKDLENATPSYEAYVTRFPFLQNFNYKNKVTLSHFSPFSLSSLKPSLNPLPQNPNFSLL